MGQHLAPQYKTVQSDFWVHDLSPFLLRFSESFGIRYYGLAYVLAFVTAWLLLKIYWAASRSNLRPEVQTSLLIAVIVGVLAGGRIGYFLLYSPNSLMTDPTGLFRLWEGGMASHGGFVGVLLALVWVVRKHHLQWWSTADVLVTLAPPGLFFGRIANFINGELWGKVSHVPWAVIFPASAPEGTPLSELAPRHPSQLYEALLEGAFLTAYTQLRFWKSGVYRVKPGQLTGEFLVLYALLRSIGEAFREPDAPLVLGISRGIFYSVFLAVAGLLILLRSHAKNYRSGNREPGC
jgi:phosphatidylglycerol:prolipoprotein diacylglycerol transferase